MSRASWIEQLGAIVVMILAIGIFGVMAQGVAQRTAEIGILPLGAQARDVLGLVLRRPAIVAPARLVIGAGSALLLTPLLAALVYGVEPDDPDVRA